MNDDFVHRGLPIPKQTELLCDHFESLVNAPSTGTLKEVSTAIEDVAEARGFMTSLAPCHFNEGGPFGVQKGLTPVEFYWKHLHGRLQRSSFWKHAEVICSGHALDFVQRFGEPLVFQSVTEVRCFDLQVKIIHASLPSDPEQGGIDLMPRVPGSLNTKNEGNHRPVVRLQAGTPITHKQFTDFVGRMSEEPVAIILETIFGSNRINPCPLCNKPGSQLTPSRNGQLAVCNACGQCSIAKLYKKILKKREFGS